MLILVRREVRLFDCKTLTSLEGLVADAVMRGEYDHVTRRGGCRAW